MDNRKLHIEQQLLRLFAQSVGERFRLKGGIHGVPLEDIVTGVDWEQSQVKGEQFGSFHVTLCELL